MSALAVAGIAAGSGALSAFGQYQAQKETNAKNEKLVREGWERDDNAVQRRMIDLEKAGINPILAAGQPAGNTAPGTPQNQPADGLSKGLEKAMTAFQIKQMEQEAELTKEKIWESKVNQETVSALGFKYQNEADLAKQSYLFNNESQPYQVRQMKQAINLLSADEKKSMLENQTLNTDLGSSAYQIKKGYENSPLENIFNKKSNYKPDYVNSLRKKNLTKNE